MAREFLNRLKMEYIYFWARRTPPCDELLPLMSQRMEGKLSWRQRISLALHNHICDWCRRYANQLLLLRKAMQKQETHIDKTPIADVTLSDDARERIKRALGEN